MSELNAVIEHFTSMAKGEIPYSNKFRLIKKSNNVVGMRTSKVNTSAMVGISPAQAAVEQSQNLVGEGGHVMLQGVRKQYKKRKAPTKRKQTPKKKRNKNSYTEEAF